jgi:hypothetical protein
MFSVRPDAGEAGPSGADRGGTVDAVIPDVGARPFQGGFRLRLRDRLPQGPHPPGAP